MKKKISLNLPDSIFNNDTIDNILKAFLVAQKDIFLNPTNVRENINNGKIIQINKNTVIKEIK